MQYNALPYQDYTTDYEIRNPFCGVFLEMGLGKTVATLTAIVKLLKYDTTRILVVAPLRVADYTWPSEISKWDHTKHLTISKILGTPDERLRALPNRTKAEIYLINYENLAWMIANLKGWWPFDMVVLDESSKVKNNDSVRFAALRLVRPLVKRLVELSGTPMGNGHIDLWAPMFLLDSGKRLYDTIGQYRREWFVQKYSGYGYEIRSDKAVKEITDRISDICVSMRQKDYLSLPERVERRYVIEMPPDLKARYKQFKKDRVMEIMGNGTKITAVNAAALYTKLSQFANGAVYDADREVHEIHDLKLQALEEIIDTAFGHPVLVIYNFQHDYTRIMKRLKKHKPVKLNSNATYDAWNRREIGVGLIHPDGGGHGLNLQAGGNIIVFFGHQWSSEKRKQVIARLERMGQLQALILTDLVLKDTMDEIVLEALSRKDGEEAGLMEAVKAEIGEYTKEINDNRYKSIQQYL